MSSRGTGTYATRRVERGVYFFLNYARSAPVLIEKPLTAVPPPPPGGDYWVSAFFDRLLGAVRSRARPAPERNIGFYDQHVSAASDLAATLTEVLRTAQVFVPLYSPGYVTKSWPRRVEAAFHSRLTSAGVARPERHVVPVLWTPVPSWWEDGSPVLAKALAEARSLGEGIPEYAENGVRALCMLKPYRSALNEVMGRLADRIVEVAEDHPLGPSPVPDLRQSRDNDRPDPSFVVTVLAPTRAEAGSSGGDTASYGDHALDWRPFSGRQAQPLANYVADVAERLGLAASITPFPEVADLSRDAPAIVLVDPWMLRAPGGRDIVSAAFDQLPRWVLPLVVRDEHDPRYVRSGRGLADEAVHLLETATGAVVSRVDDLVALESEPSRAVTRARRAFLKLWPGLSTGG
jgi:FxsC-like protein